MGRLRSGKRDFYGVRISGVNMIVAKFGAHLYGGILGNLPGGAMDEGKLRTRGVYVREQLKRHSFLGRPHQ